MKETEQHIKTSYELGAEFYANKITEAQKRLEEASSPFEQLEAMEDIENASLKALQLSRREEVLENGKQIDTVKESKKESA